MKKYFKYKNSDVEWIREIPYDWSFLKLKYLVDYKNGNAFKSEDFSKDEKVPVVRIGEVSDIINFDDCVKLPLSFLDTFIDFIIKKNDILVGLTGATIGKSGRYSYDDPALLNQRVCRLRNNGLTLNGFLYFFVKSELFTQNILFNCYGGGQDNIGKDEILNMLYPLPSLIEQNLLLISRIYNRQ